MAGNRRSPAPSPSGAFSSHPPPSPAAPPPGFYSCSSSPSTSDVQAPPLTSSRSRAQLLLGHELQRMEQEKLQKLALKGPNTGEQGPSTPISAASSLKAEGGTGPAASTSASVSMNKNRNYAMLAGTIAGLSAVGWHLLGKEAKKTEVVE